MKPERQSYEGHAFHPDLGTEVASGTITLDRYRFTFECDCATVTIPMNELRIQFRESDPRVFFHHDEQPDWTLYTADDAILRHRVFAQRNDLREQVRQERERGIYFKAAMACLIFFAAFGLIALILTWVSGKMVQVAVTRIPVSWETNFGNSVLADFELEFDMIEDPELQSRIEALAAPLLKVLPDQGFNYQFHVVDSPYPNAFALPGGHVLITSGLLVMTDRSEEVAGVLAHEFAHVTHDHAYRQIVAAAGPFVIFNIFFGGTGVMGAISQGSGFLLNQSFSQAYEHEADDVGWKYLVAANIDPRGLEEFLRKVRKVEEEMPMPEIQALSSHPATSERIKRLQKKWLKFKHEGPFLDLDAEIRKVQTTHKKK